MEILKRMFLTLLTFKKSNQIVQDSIKNEYSFDFTVKSIIFSPR